MKKFIIFALIPATMYGISKEDFKQSTRIAFENKYVRFNTMIENEKITQENGLGALFKQLEGTTFDDALNDAKSREVAEKLCAVVRNDETCSNLFESMKNTDENEKIKARYDYLKQIQLKAKDILSQDCLSMEFNEEKSEGPHDLAWMKIDCPEWAQLNVGKHFDEECKKAMVGINLGMSLLVQEMLEVVENK